MMVGFLPDRPCKILLPIQSPFLLVFPIPSLLVCSVDVLKFLTCSLSTRAIENEGMDREAEDDWREDREMRKLG
jgi:hypothetical protein